jgi:hypothetical protein
LSAFANTPGGGTILFGVDEASGFEISGVYDPAACQKALATTCRSALDPPIAQQSWIERIEGGQIVVAEIPEADASAKPVRVKATGKSYLRSHDGDFPLSAIEEQAFIASRAAPHFDRMAVPGAVREDLDKELCASYIDACRSSSSSLAWTEPAYQSWRRRSFDAARNAAQIDQATPYTLRHSFASLLLHEGHSVIYVARQLGHDARLTLARYGHVIDELEDQPQIPAEQAIREARSSPFPHARQSDTKPHSRNEETPQKRGFSRGGARGTRTPDLLGAMQEDCALRIANLQGI